MRQVLICALLLVTLCGALFVVRNDPTLPAQAALPERYKSTILVPATGVPGSAGGTVTSPDKFHGFIRALYVDYATGISATTDVTIQTVSPAATVLSLTDTFTDGWYYPAVQFTGNTGAAISGAYQAFPIEDNLTVNYTQTSTSTLVITVLWGD